MAGDQTLRHDRDPTDAAEQNKPHRNGNQEVPGHPGLGGLFARNATCRLDKRPRHRIGLSHVAGA